MDPAITPRTPNYAIASLLFPVAAVLLGFAANQSSSDAGQVVWPVLILFGSSLPGAGLALASLVRHEHPRWISWLGLAINAIPSLAILLLIFRYKMG